MKIFTNKNFIQKLVIVIVAVILLNFSFASPVKADPLGGTLMSYMRDFVTFIGDVRNITYTVGINRKLD